VRRARPKTFIDVIRGGFCQFIIGDPKKFPIYCARKHKKGSPYCAEHHKKCYKIDPEK